MRRRKCSLGLLLAALAAVACTSAAARERARLTERLGHDPLDALRAIGAAPDAAAARALADALRAEPAMREQNLAVLRLGFGSGDGDAVLGAAILAGGHGIAVPELRAAAASLVPRLAEPALAPHLDRVLPLLGSVDLDAVARVVPAMPAATAVELLGQLHRLVRGEHVATFCALARATDEPVRGAAFANAHLGARFSGEHTELLLATWLRLRERRPEVERDGLAPVLRGVLRAYVEDPQDVPPVAPCARWLVASHAAPHDLRLLRLVATGPEPLLQHAALWAIGGMFDDESLAFVRGLDAASSLSALLAQARRGDPLVLAALLAGDARELSGGLAAATPAQRSAFAQRVAAAPAAWTLDRLTTLRTATAAAVLDRSTMPIADEWLRELEPLVLAAPGVDPRVLAALTALPGTATARVADALLALPAERLVTAIDDTPGLASARDVGCHGGWPFLEVTRPDALRTRLREGLRSGDARVRARCAELSLRLGDVHDHERLVDWLDASRADAATWALLARDATPAVRALLLDRVAAARDADGAAAQLPALAAAFGMPFDLARRWQPRAAALGNVRARLLAGDAGGAFVADAALTNGLDAEWAALGAWPDPQVQTFVAARRSAARVAPRERRAFDVTWPRHAADAADAANAENAANAVNAADASGANAAIDEEARELTHDGRYATHDGIERAWRVHRAELPHLAFWIDELGSNCCRAVFAEEVMEALFDCAAAVFDFAESLEPARARLRRRLLPVAERLRWSRLADAFVVAGA